jgi:hypothetical protein
MARLDVRRNKDGQSEVVVEGANKRYSFLVRKKSDSKPFFLQSVKEVQGSSTSSADARPSVLRLILRLPYELLIPAASIVSSPHFVVRSVSPLVRDGKNLLKVEFDRPNPPNFVAKKNRRDNGGYEGFLVVSPDERWVLYEFECANKKGNLRQLMTGSVQYEGVSDGFPVPKRAIRQVLNLPGREIVWTSTFDFLDFRFAEVPDRDFTLAAFGFAEDAAMPPSAPLPPSRLGYWFLALALTSLAAAVLFKVASSRAKRPSVS